MFVVAVVSQKGGSGKTTLTGHLSVQASLAGNGPVAIVDTDPQGSLAAWWNERETEEPAFVQTNLQDLNGHLDNLRQAGVKMVVIDTPPAITSAIHDVIKVADYVVVPTKPSPHDLRAVGATVKLIQSCSKPMVFVLNDASPRAKITFEAAIALSQHGTVAPVTIHHRTLYASSMIDGRTAMEIEPNGQSAIEIHGLWEYLNARLNSEILPTAIGLDAMNRFDGTRAKKKSFSVPVDNISDEVPIEAIDHAVGDAIEEAIEEALIAKTTPPLAQPINNPINGGVSVHGQVQAKGDDLWAGFDEDESQNHSSGDVRHHDFRTSTRTDGGQKVFGRRQVV